jgi:tetratricopeptide (TPR) repeat protein/SAM-dependent methyltransferase
MKADPSQDQINALVKLYNSGQMVETEQACRELLQAYPQSFAANNVLGAALLGQGKLQDAVKSYERAIQIKADSAEAYTNHGVALKALGHFDEALKSYNKAIEIKPGYAEAYNNRGVALQGLERSDEALESYNKTIQLKPNFAEAYSNRGNALKDLGQLDEAVASYKKAIQLKPDLAEAYANRGNALRDLGQLNEALESYNKAILLKPDLAEAYSNRGGALQELGQLDAAITNYQKAVSINPQSRSIWSGFSDVLQVARFTSCSDDLVYYLLQILEQSTVRPVDMSGAVISALHNHPIVSRIFELSKSAHIDEDIDHLTVQLSTVPLLLRMMELSPIADLNLEKMLTGMRKSMLHKAANGTGEAQGLTFYGALAMHCFTNEYVFSESEAEKQEIEFLQQEVKATLAKEGIVLASHIAVLGAYRPLHSYSWADDLLKTKWAGAIKKVIVAQIDNVREEQALRSKIRCLTSIEDEVSQLVRSQYEESPFPRWVNTELSDKPRVIRQVLQSIKLNFDVQQFSNKPDILVAGCGTGQHALSTASRFLNCNVLAVDLSLSSLSYAIRKTQELGFANIEYMQGDILNLDSMDKQFDLIESAGVLHHMADPMAGWKILTDRLKLGGLMKIGLYSELARKSVVAAREIISEMGLSSTTRDILKFRTAVLDPDGRLFSKLFKITKYGDFFSTSELRDLLFHVQEHRFTLPQIKEILELLGLTFAGFEFPDEKIVRQFIQMYPDPQSIYCLDAWNDFELANADVFIGMYQFWAQKNVDV